MPDSLLKFTPASIYCPLANVHIDPWKPVDFAIITHAHSDHAKWGNKHYLAHKDSEQILRMRLGETISLQTVEYHEPFVINGVKFSLHPAGHILGSAQVRVEHRGEVWVASGDYKRQADPTCRAFEPQRCHTFITEATFALPVFRWDEPDVTVAEMESWLEEMRQARRAAVLFGCALGKAQRVLAELRARRAARPVFVHGALLPLIEIYRAAGVDMPPVRRATDVERGV